MVGLVGANNNLKCLIKLKIHKIHKIHKIYKNPYKKFLAVILKKKVHRKASKISFSILLMQGSEMYGKTIENWYCKTYNFEQSAIIDLDCNLLFIIQPWLDIQLNILFGNLIFSFFLASLPKCIKCTKINRYKITRIFSLFEWIYIKIPKDIVYFFFLISEDLADDGNFLCCRIGGFNWNYMKITSKIQFLVELKFNWK